MAGWQPYRMSSEYFVEHSGPRYFFIKSEDKIFRGCVRLHGLSSSLGIFAPRNAHDHGLVALSLFLPDEGPARVSRPSPVYGAGTHNYFSKSWPP